MLPLDSGTFTMGFTQFVGCVTGFVISAVFRARNAFSGRRVHTNDIWGGVESAEEMARCCKDMTIRLLFISFNYAFAEKNVLIFL